MYIENQQMQRCPSEHLLRVGDGWRVPLIVSHLTYRRFAATRFPSRVVKRRNLLSSDRIEVQPAISLLQRLQLDGRDIDVTRCTDCIQDSIADLGWL